MSGKEAPRPGLVRSVSAGLITNRQAADALRLTLRHVQRLKARFRADDVGGLVHRGRGQPSPRRLADPVRGEIRRRTAFVSKMAVSLLQPGAERSFEIDGLHAPVSRCAVFTRAFFALVETAITRSLAFPGPPAGDGTEYNFRELGVQAMLHDVTDRSRGRKATLVQPFRVSALRARAEPPTPARRRDLERRLRDELLRLHPARTRKPRAARLDVGRLAHRIGNSILPPQSRTRPRTGE